MYTADNITIFLKKSGYEINFHHGGYTSCRIYLIIPKELDFNGRIRIIENPYNYYEIETMNINIEGYDSDKYSIVSTPFSINIPDDDPLNEEIPGIIRKKLDNVKDIILKMSTGEIPDNIKKLNYNTISGEKWTQKKFLHFIPLSLSKKVLYINLSNKRMLDDTIIKKFSKNSNVFPGETLSIKSIDQNTIKVSLTWTFKNGRLTEKQVPIYNLVKDFITNLRGEIH